MSKMNRLGNAHNKYQNFDMYPRALSVCSAGMLRSPTAAWVLSNDPFNFNTRAVGASDEYALMEVDDVHLEWADYVFFMEEKHHRVVSERFPSVLSAKKFFVLDVPDDFPYRHPELVKMITDKVKGVLGI
jgi:predicted protein tyrosine phosphatase